jgi:hypothetical protein
VTSQDLLFHAQCEEGCGYSRDEDALSLCFQCQLLASLADRVQCELTVYRETASPFTRPIEPVGASPLIRS